jgi:hypothetical protein
VTLIPISPDAGLYSTTTDLYGGGPATPSSAYVRMAQRWELPHALLSGTRAMRRSKWLPRHPAEREAYYDDRLARTVLINFYGGAIKNLAGRPFAKPVALLQGTSAEIEALTDDIDGRGQNLTQFARGLFEDALVDGQVHVLAALPPGMEELSLAEQRELGLRPYLRHVPARNLISSLVDPYGSLVRIVIYEPYVRPSQQDPWIEETVHRFRVIWRDRWELHERVGAAGTGQGGTMEMVGGGAHDFGSIPLTTIYFNRVGDLEAYPPLENLAWLNLKYFQVYSDQDSTLHFVSIPILFGKGIGDVDAFQVAAGTASLVDDENASLEYVEHQGGAVGERRQQLQDLEDLMLSEAADMLTRRPSGVTATAVALEFSGPRSWLEACAQSLQVGLDHALMDCGRWLGLDQPRAVTNVFQEFGIGRSREDAEVLFRACRPAVGQRPLLSDKTFNREMKRRGIIEDVGTWAEEKREIDEQGPVDLGMPGAPLRAGATPGTPGVQPKRGADQAPAQTA